MLDGHEAVKGSPVIRLQGPPPVAQLEDFLNSDDRFHGVDYFDPPHGPEWVLGRLGIGGAVAEDELRLLRSALRTVVVGDHPDHESLHALEARHPVAARLAADDGSLRSELGGQDAVAELLALVHTAVRAGTWSRIRACRNPGCGWIYFDGSKNHSGRWCSTECSQVMRTRAYRARRAGDGTPRATIGA
jgi:hypothetical protein